MRASVTLVTDDRPGIDTKLHLHPIVIRLGRPDFEHERAANHIDEEPRRGLDVGHGEPHRVRARQPRQTATHRFDAGSQIMVISRSFCSSNTLSLTSANFCRCGSSMCLSHSARLVQFS